MTRSARSHNEELISQATAAKTLAELLALYQIDDKWDYVIVGDGSATTWQHEMGWGSCLIERTTGERFDFGGGGNCGTNILAEMLAYVHALFWLVGNRPVQLSRVHIITDCEHLVKASRGAHSKETHWELWQLFAAFKHRGLRLYWHWVPRDTIDLNKFGHELANACRLAMKNGDLLSATLKKLKVESLNQLNP